MPGAAFVDGLPLTPPLFFLGDCSGRVLGSGVGSRRNMLRGKDPLRC